MGSNSQIAKITHGTSGNSDGKNNLASRTFSHSVTVYQRVQ